MRRALAIGIGTALLLGAAACGREPAPALTTFSFGTMGTVAGCDLVLPPGLTAAAARDLVTAAYDSLNAACNAWAADSELSRLNRAAPDSAVTVSPLLAACLAAADSLHRLSGGAFDPTAGPLMDLWGFTRGRGRLPAAAEVDSVRALLGRWRLDAATGAVTRTAAGTRFDLGGIAKGLAVDLAAAHLRAAGLGDGLIDLGGNLCCLGGAPGRDDWRVGIRDPRDRDRLFASVTVSGATVATSGSYERFVTIDGRRYGHIMNPATGRPAEGLLSATVIAPRGILADGLSTTLFVLGPEAAWQLLARSFPQVEAVLVVPAADAGRARVLATLGLRGRLTILPEYDDRYELVFVDVQAPGSATRLPPPGSPTVRDGE